MKEVSAKFRVFIGVMCLAAAFFTAVFTGKTRAFAADTASEESGAQASSVLTITGEDDPEADGAHSDALEETSCVSVLNLYSEALLASTTSAGSDNEIGAYGIDVSKHQGEIDWAKVKADGVSFAIIRVGYRGYSGGTIVQDTCAIDNIEGALDAGIEVGVYFFSTALNQQEAVEEAQFVLSVIDGYDITYPVVYDCEGYDNSSYRNYGLSSEVRTENAIAFLNYVEAAGYQGMMYGSKNALQDDTYWGSSTLEKYYDMWVAQYYYYTSSTQYPSFSAIVSSGKTISYTGEYRFWQFSSQGSISGISGSVDLDLEYATDDYIMYSDVVVYTEDTATDTDATDTDAEETKDYTTGWVKDEEGNIYYFDNGVMQTGFLEADGYTYYFAESGVMQTGLCNIDGKIYYFTYKGVMWTGWVTLNDGTSETATYYFGSDGAALTNGWSTIDDEKYYFNASGRVHLGWRTIDGEKYYCDADSGTMQTGFVKISGNLYYFDPSTGVMHHSGWLTVSGSTYYTNPSGRVHLGWRTINGEKYYSDPMTGAFKMNTWATISGKKYFFNPSGRLHYGWRTIDGEKYYCDPDTGVMQTGWMTIGGKKYFFNPSGRLHYGWRTIDGEKYYCDPNTGVMQTGWVTISGKKYYFNVSGRLHYGWRTIDGEKYYADPDTGVIQTNKWVTISGKKYFFNPSGRLHYGWRTIDGEKYYCDTTTGVMQTGWVTINGKQYYFYSDGRLKQ